MYKRISPTASSSGWPSIGRSSPPTDMHHLRRNSWDLYSLCYYSTEGICFQVPFPAFCRRKAFFVLLRTSKCVQKHTRTLTIQTISKYLPAAAATMTHHMTVSHGAVAHDAINDRAQMPDSFRQGDDSQQGQWYSCPATAQAMGTARAHYPREAKV